MEKLISLLNIYLPVADLTVNLTALVLIGVFTGLLSGTFGLGGGLIIVPALGFIGVDPAIAVASSTNQMTASSLSGFMAYAGRNRVDYKLAIVMLLGGIPGSLVGSILFEYFTNMGTIDFVISIGFLFVLGSIGIFTFIDAIKILAGKVSKKRPDDSEPRIKMPLHVQFPSCHASCSIFSPIIIGFIGGILISVMGIGGSLVTIPAMIYLLRVSEAFTAGTTNLQLIFTSILSTLLHSNSGTHMDIVLSTILMVCTSLGAQIGVRIASGIKPNNYRILLALLILALCAEVLFNLIITPSNLFVIESL